MKKENCFYCTKNHELSDLMIKICDFENSTLYLFKDQRYPGRCVLAFHDHREVASVLKKIFHADKINYAIYGDLVSHFHVHIVPKKKDGPEWGIPFTDMKEKIYLTNEEYLSRIKLIKSSL